MNEERARSPLSKPLRIAVLAAAVLVLLYAAGYGAALMESVAAWRAHPEAGELPELPSPVPWKVYGALFHLPQGPMALGGTGAVIGVLVLMMRPGRAAGEGTADKERRLVVSSAGSYGTAAFLTDQEARRCFAVVPEPKTREYILGKTPEGKVITLPPNSRLNSNIAVCGASGTGKSRSVSRNLILQAVRRGESVIITDPKSELYASMSGYLRDQGYVVRVFNLVDMAHGDSWDILGEVQGSELMAQTLASVILANTGGAGKDPFWYNAELNLLVALILYLCFEMAPENRSLSKLYGLLSQEDDGALERRFRRLKDQHLCWDGKVRFGSPCLAPYNIFRQSSENVRNGVIVGLGSKLQVLQVRDVRNITTFPETDLTLPGRERCAYFCIVSDQDSTFDFLSSLFFSCLFIRLIRYADGSCPGGTLPVKVMFVLDEFPNCCLIPDFTKKCSTIRSRGVAVAVFFQNVGQMRNRYPNDQWQEILGACDTTLFLGCTDMLTAQYFSDRIGAATVEVQGTSRDRSALQMTQYTPQYRENRSLGRRPLLTPDEVLRMPPDRVLIFIRGQKVYQAARFDYSLHSEYRKLRPEAAAEHVPDWKKNGLDQALDDQERAFWKEQLQDGNPPAGRRTSGTSSQGSSRRKLNLGDVL